MSSYDLRELSERLMRIRKSVLERQPFFGRLLMRITFGFQKCDTAYTDMQKIVFDPEFANRLDDSQLEFVMLHELLHCVLKHCVRGEGKIDRIYNIACDIVVNSMILHSNSLDRMIIDGNPAMCKTPDGRDGYLFTAEEVYSMLLKDGKDGSDGVKAVLSFDSHEQWQSVGNDNLLEDVWNANVCDAYSKMKQSNGGVPAGMQREVEELQDRSRIDWRHLLRSYLQNDRYDFVFTKPDRRYSSDVILPSFQEDADGAKLEKIWFAVDTSGSIDLKSLNEFFFEMKDVVNQIGNVSGFISFFDCDVTKPVEFQDKNDISSVKPVGGGGTSFHAVFNAMRKYFEYELPKLVIILTDGYAPFPDERAAEGTDVIWVILNSGVEAPWGECVHINT